MLLPLMPRDLILDYIASLMVPWADLTAVTLVDCQTIVGHLGGSPELEAREGQVPMAVATPSIDSWQFLQSDQLVVSYRNKSGEIRIYVPLESIANLAPAPFSQTVYSEYVDFDVNWSDARERIMAEYLENHEEDELELRRDILEFQAARRHERFEKFKETLGLRLGDADADPETEAAASYLTNEFNSLDRLLLETVRAAAISVSARHGLPRGPLCFAPIPVRHNH